MALKQPSAQKWTIGTMVTGVVWFVFNHYAGKALDDMGGTMRFVLSILLSPLLPAAVVVGSVLAWGYFSWCFKKEQRENTEGHYAQFMKAWDGLRMTRRAFEEKMGSLYAAWNKEPSGLNAIKAHVYRAGCPAGLPPSQEHIWQYVRRVLSVWKGDPGTLLDFCVAVYVRQDNQFMPKKEEWDMFDEIRMDLSKFWDFWGAKCFNEHVMDEKRMLKIVPGQDWQILLLIYLELARAYHYESTGPGKRWLFQLGKVVTRW